MNRKDFIKRSSLASLGIIATAPSLFSNSKILGANKTINIGVIGTGNRGAGLIPLLNQIDGVNVSACCDVLPFRLEHGLSQTAHKAKSYVNYKKLLDNKDIDAVLVSTPFSTHSKISMDALEAGKHVYCEKTMAKSLDGIHHLTKKVSESNTVFQTGHQYHSSRLYTHVVDLIKNGEIGKVISFESQWNRNGNWRRHVPNPSLERAINWRMYREYSGGLVAELCSHQIDFANWVLGEVPNKITGFGGVDYWKDGRETYDNVHLIHQYPSGVKATYRCLTANALNDYQIKVHGDKGTIALDYTKAWIYYEKGFEKEIGNVDGVSGATVNYDGQKKGTPIKVSHTDPTKQALIDFRDNIIDNKTPISNVTTGANTAKAVQFSLNAMDNEKVIYWN